MESTYTSWLVLAVAQMHDALRPEQSRRACTGLAQEVEYTLTSFIITLYRGMHDERIQD